MFANCMPFKIHSTQMKLNKTKQNNFALVWLILMYAKWLLLLVFTLSEPFKLILKRKMIRIFHILEYLSHFYQAKEYSWKTEGIIIQTKTQTNTIPRTQRKCQKCKMKLTQSDTKNLMIDLFCRNCCLSAT